MSRSYAPEHAENPESWYRDLLAAQVDGETEARLPFGKADVMTARTVWEVEPVIHWRDGVRQVLGYAAQCGRRPAIAIYGKPSIAVKVLGELGRVPPPGVELWWLSGGAFTHIADAALAAELQATTPARTKLEGPWPALKTFPPDSDFTGLLTLPEIAAAHGQPLSRVKNWAAGGSWPTPAGMRGRSFLYREAEIDAAVRARLRREVEIPGDPDELLDTKTAAAEAGISWDSLRAYISDGKWPQPDDEGYGVKRWKRSTIRAEMVSRRPIRRRA